MPIGQGRLMGIFLVTALWTNMMHSYRTVMHAVKYILAQEHTAICFDIFSIQVQEYRHGK